jgi:exopolyphosphatase/guanosine-5'-triphosphate,3'-diphosphate pyrophosphatase
VNAPRAHAHAAKGGIAQHGEADPERSGDATGGRTPPSDRTPCASASQKDDAGRAEPSETSPHTGNGHRKHRRRKRRSQRRPPIYGALDLGTNNCRLLVAKPAADGFRVIDAFSRIGRLGEGASRTGRLSEDAMDRTIEALKVCTSKMARRNVTRFRLIATEACRSAANGDHFIERVYQSTGLKLEVIDRETEARLAVAGSASLIEADSSNALVFDIGGGSTELMYLTMSESGHELREWISLPVGVVTLAERHGGIDVDRTVFDTMISEVRPLMDEFIARLGNGGEPVGSLDHMLGTSGTVTTIAGVHLELERYDRARVDGCWITNESIDTVTSRLLEMSYDERAANPCIGPDRADLVLAGCAILDAILQNWPCERVRVADRGLREGILTELMMEDGNVGRSDARRPRRRGHRGRRHNRSGNETPDGTAS